MSSVTDTAGGGTHADRSSRNAVSVAETSYKRRRTRRRKRKGGRKRGPRSMGRFPFVTVAEKYLSLCEGNQKPSTLKTKRRNLYMIHRDLQTLKEQGKIESTSPKKLTSEDIIHLVGLWRGRGVKEGSICKYISVLQCVLQYAKNTAIACAKIEFAPLMPEDDHSDLLGTLSKDEWAAIMQSAETTDFINWRLTLGYAMIVFALVTGARSIEFINCKMSDINLAAGTVNLVEVKGKGTYGKPRTSWIHVDGRKFLSNYLQKREEILEQRGFESEYFFPALQNLHKGVDKPYSHNGTRILKDRAISNINKRTGLSLSFDYRTCRRTYAQALKDEGADIEAISVLMGHKTTKTTEKAYARMTPRQALALVQDVFSPKDPSHGVMSISEMQSLLIEIKSLVSG